jgi:hypothetical protein
VENLRRKLQFELEQLLFAFIARNDKMHYVQGVNDIGVVLLLVVGTTHALDAIEAICHYYIKYLFITNMNSYDSSLFLYRMKGLFA